MPSVDQQIQGTRELGPIGFVTRNRGNFFIDLGVYSLRAGISLLAGGEQ